MLDKFHQEYYIYLGKYLGVALFAGSVVHTGTLQYGFNRYLILGVVGLLLVILANTFEAKQKGQAIDLKYFSVILGLSFATGFFSGGIQHYLDNPIYAGFLLSIGFLGAYIFYFLKEKKEIKFTNLILVGLLSLFVLAFSNYYMNNFTEKKGEHNQVITSDHSH